MPGHEPNQRRGPEDPGSRRISELVLRDRQAEADDLFADHDRIDESLAPDGPYPGRSLPAQYLQPELSGTAFADALLRQQDR